MLQPVAKNIDETWMAEAWIGFDYCLQELGNPTADGRCGVHLIKERRQGYELLMTITGGSTTTMIMVLVQCHDSQ